MQGGECPDPAKRNNHIYMRPADELLTNSGQQRVKNSKKYK